MAVFTTRWRGIYSKVEGYLQGGEVFTRWRGIYDKVEGYLQQGGEVFTRWRGIYDKVERDGRVKCLVSFRQFKRAKPSLFFFHPLLQETGPINAMTSLDIYTDSRHQPRTPSKSQNIKQTKKKSERVSF